jgi:hypothetical protein
VLPKQNEIHMGGKRQLCQKSVSYQQETNTRGKEYVVSVRPLVPGVFVITVFVVSEGLGVDLVRLF